MNSIQQRAAKLSTWTKVAIVGIGGFIVSPIIFFVIQGLIGLVIAAGIGLACIATAPMIGLKVANWRMKGVKAEASKNPVETRWNLYNERVKALEAYASEIQRFTAKLGIFETQLAKLRQDYPDEVEPFERMVKAMTQLKLQREAEYRRAREALDKHKRETEKAERIWTMAMAARDLGEAANMKIDPLKEIAEKTALDAVELEMNNSFAQLDRLMLERVEETSVPASLVIDITPAKVRS